MLSAWLLPEHIADVLPPQAARLEALRRLWLDQAGRCGFELVVPPLLEHLESLLSGTGRELDLRTFKLVDQLSGRTLGLRADTTPQAARIDAHLLNRDGITRLCYCGPVLHTRPATVAASREPLQFGAEIFGDASLQADLEAAELALDGLHAAWPDATLVLDLADARVLRGVLAGVPLPPAELQEVVQALSDKDAAALEGWCTRLPQAVGQSLRSLLRLYGGQEVLDAARQSLPDRPLVRGALQDLQTLAAELRSTYPALSIGFDLADMSGYAYYSGMRFAIYAAGHANPLARGGRYDEVGAVFGRNRPAVGFSLDLKQLAEATGPAPATGAVLARRDLSPGWRQAVRRLRDQGQVVICLPPGEPVQGQAWACDRELIPVEGRWVVQALSVGTAA